MRRSRSRQNVNWRIGKLCQTSVVPTTSKSSQKPLFMKKNRRYWNWRRIRCLRWKFCNPYCKQLKDQLYYYTWRWILARWARVVCLKIKAFANMLQVRIHTILACAKRVMECRVLRTLRIGTGIRMRFGYIGSIQILK